MGLRVVENPLLWRFRNARPPNLCALIGQIKHGVTNQVAQWHGLLLFAQAGLYSRIQI